MSYTEEQEQNILAGWLDSRLVRWCHVPNGGQRNHIVGAKMKRQGVKRGVPDVLIFTPPPPLNQAVGTAVELKRRGKHFTKPRPEQLDWLRGLRECGWHTIIARGADDAIAKLTELGY